MRIVFCGSGDVATPTLEALGGAGHEILAVLTRPPHRAGRGGKLRATPIEQRCQALGLPLVRCDDINSPRRQAELRALGPELIVVVDFGHKIGRAVWEVPRYQAINMHASLLPALRGAAPVNWAIIAGLQRTGVTTFQLADLMDAGSVLLSESLQIDPEETAEELRPRLAQLGGQVVLRTVAGLEAGSLQPRPQNEEEVTFAPKLTKADGAIDFADGATAVVNRIRGTWPWPGGHADFVRPDGERVRVILVRARIADEDRGGSVEPGIVTEALHVSAGDRCVQVLQLKVAGKRLMTWKDFVNGYHIRGGERFARVDDR